MLWWASHHRHHHKTSDTAEDVHSPAQRGFWYSHLGWILSSEWTATDLRLVPDLAKYPELHVLNHKGIQLLPAVALAVAFALIGGAQALVWGFFVSTVLLWHGTFTINSLAHLFGSRRYATDDDSRNNWLLADRSRSARAGTTTTTTIRARRIRASSGGRSTSPTTCCALLQLTGLVWDLRRPPPDIVRARG